MPDFDDDEAPTRPRSFESRPADFEATIRALQATIQRLKLDLTSERQARKYDRTAHDREVREYRSTNSALRLRVRNLEDCVASMTARFELLSKANAAVAARKTIPAPDFLVTDIEEK